MNRLAFLLAAAVLTLGVDAAHAGTNEVRDCGVAHDGRRIVAGNSPWRNYHWTRCSFAWATYGKLRREDEEGSGIGWRFWLKVRGQRLLCRLDTEYSEAFTCRNDDRFVLIYRPI